MIRYVSFMNYGMHKVSGEWLVELGFSLPAFHSLIAGKYGIIFFGYNFHMMLFGWMVVIKRLVHFTDLNLIYICFRSDANWNREISIY